MNHERASEAPLHQTNPCLIRDNLVPVITPKTASGEVDTDSIDRLVGFHQWIGTGALFAVGGLGRFRALTDVQRIEAARAFITSNERRGSPLVIFAGATSETSSQTLENAETMAKLGADAVFVAPLYFAKPEEIPAFFRRAREAVGERLPLLLYNNPDFTRFGDAPNLSPRVLNGIKNDVSAVKDSSCDPDLFARYAEVGLPMYTGDEPRLVQGLRRRGSRGSVGGLGNVLPLPGRLVKQLSENNNRDDAGALAAEFDAKIATLRRVIDSHPEVPPPDAVAAVFHWCLAEAGVVQAPERELSRILTLADKDLLRHNGFIPTYHTNNDKLY